MGDYFVCLVLGLVVGFAAGGATVAVRYDDGRAECEIDLPRSERCQFIWVPEATE